MIAAFVYDFPHFKSAQGLFALKRAGFHDVLAIAAPFRSLGLPDGYQFRPRDPCDAIDTAEACEALGYHFLRVDHIEAAPLIKRASCAVILGARVLPADVAECGVPIINIHPGVLPLNRGLDCLKWAVYESLPQAITAHVIDRRIDRGTLVFEKVIPVYPEDSPGDLYNRLMWAQVKGIPLAISCLNDALEAGGKIGRGIYRKPMTRHQDDAVRERWLTYKRYYASICDRRKAA